MEKEKDSKRPSKRKRKGTEKANHSTKKEGMYDNESIMKLQNAVKTTEGRLYNSHVCAVVGVPHCVLPAS